MSIEIVMQLILVYAFAVGGIKLDNLQRNSLIEVERRMVATLTPPDFGIFRTAMRFPYVRFISTFNFS